MNDTGAEDEAVAAGESGRASGGNEDAKADVLVGEIPDEHDLSRMLWTARCHIHGLLGTVDSREEAERIRARHLLTH
jgi:hypothetical protein